MAHQAPDVERHCVDVTTSCCLVTLVQCACHLFALSPLMSLHVSSATLAHQLQTGACAPSCSPSCIHALTVHRSWAWQGCFAGVLPQSPCCAHACTHGATPAWTRRALRRRSLSTSTYQLSFLEVPSGLKIVLTTSPHAGALRPLLQRLYSELYVALVVKDPTQQLGEPIRSAVFEEELDAFFQRNGLL